LTEGRAKALKGRLGRFGRLGRLAWLLFRIVPVAAATAPIVHAQELPLQTDWRIQSSSLAGADGARISSPSYTPAGWHRATVPSTIVGALVDDGVFRARFSGVGARGPDGAVPGREAATAAEVFYGMNLRRLPGMTYEDGLIFDHFEMDPLSPFAVPWWYRTVFRLPSAFNGRRVTLHFDGINYRANVWLNGRRIADSTEIAGAFRRYELDVSDLVERNAPNVLAVQVFAPTPMDLAPTWLNWNPEPPDKMMGLWRRVYLSGSGDVVIRYPQVISSVDTATLARADLTVGALLRNLADHPVAGTLRGRIGKVAFEQKIVLGAHDSADVQLTPERFPQLRLAHPRLWWPAELGDPALHELSLSFVRDGVVSDSRRIRFGIRQITSELTPGGARLFRVNGRRILIRGGGWTPDMFFRPQPARQIAQMAYALDMHLNTLRLEGKLEDDAFWERADSLGLLVMAGWPCCTIWEKWPKWHQEQYAIAAASQRDQLRRLRSHPSALVWLNGSDKPPPRDVERSYIEILRQEHWPNPYLSSASAKPAELTGASGVKMPGPYDWVPPSYWVQDTAHGGAFGFNTETSAGAAVPPIESMRRMLPARDLWPIDSVWLFHSAGGRRLRRLDRYTTALNARYGAATSVEGYTLKSQLMSYENERAMFEAYRRNKYESTGIVQWMFNNAWPSIYWHLFDWYLAPGGGYFGTKKANEPVHVMYSYDDGSIAIVNALRREVRHVHLHGRVLGLDMSVAFALDTLLDIPPDSSVRVARLAPGVATSPTYFVDLKLTDADGVALSSNFYWLSSHPDVPDFDSTTYYVTATKQYADFTALASLPPATVTAAATFTRHGATGEAHVTLENDGDVLAFFVRLRLLAGDDGEEVLPIEWSDNYVSLLPGEKLELTARYALKDLHGRAPALQVGGWNIR
jgi:exo-1,4-beta-D-glucosaminidase